MSSSQHVPLAALSEGEAAIDFNSEAKLTPEDAAWSTIVWSEYRSRDK